MKPYLSNNVLDKIPKTSSIDDLKTKAEEEFTKYYGTYPTCAVYAPGSLTIGGKNRNVESKSLSMAVQLVTVVVGKRSHGNKWCYVKTMAEEIVGSKVFDIYLNTESLEISTEESLWVRYVKGTIQSFKTRRANVPGFKIVIASNVPMKRGLGSSSALVVALYTFLEAITNTYTGNILEKTLACYLAERLAANPCRVHLGDILTSIIGIEDKIFCFNPKSLHFKTYNWDSKDVYFIFIECGKKEWSPFCTEMKNKEMLTLINTRSKWRTHPLPDSMIQLLFSQETIKMVNDINIENDRIKNMIEKIESEEWEHLGRI
ncbi:galactokinase-like [Osmia bicornis bicornis]|uniref:galactokinase-like n=1 Tax=Osmia bicornis bicornis TaxID=1437191 RepID=UPI001EAF40AC|nr:galactokinase-like [Osmia bicornis bicornis]